MGNKVEEIFTSTVARRYQNECKRTGTEPTYHGLLKYAIEHKLISPGVVRDFAVIAEYPAYLYHEDGGKRRAVWSLEDSLGVPERTIYRILRRGQRVFWTRATHCKKKRGK